MIDNSAADFATASIEKADHVAKLYIVHHFHQRQNSVNIFITRLRSDCVVSEHCIAAACVPELKLLTVSVRR